MDQWKFSPFIRIKKSTARDIDPNDLATAQQVTLRRLAKELTRRMATEFIFCFALQRYEVQSTHCFTSKANKGWFRADILLVYNDSDQRRLPDNNHVPNSVELGEHQYRSEEMRGGKAGGSQV